MLPNNNQIAFVSDLSRTTLLKSKKTLCFLMVKIKKQPEEDYVTRKNVTKNNGILQKTKAR